MNTGNQSPAGRCFEAKACITEENPRLACLSPGCIRVTWGALGELQQQCPPQIWIFLISDARGPGPACRGEVQVRKACPTMHLYCKQPSIIYDPFIPDSRLIKIHDNKTD